MNFEAMTLQTRIVGFGGLLIVAWYWWTLARNIFDGVAPIEKAWWYRFRTSDLNWLVYKRNEDGVAFWLISAIKALILSILSFVLVSLVCAA